MTLDDLMYKPGLLAGERFLISGNSSDRAQRSV